MLRHLRRDKYEKDVKEYWIDVKCTGELRRAVVEVTIRHFEVVDIQNRAIPTPAIGNGPGPLVPAFEDPEDPASSENEHSADDEQPRGRPRSKKADARKAAEKDSALAEVQEDSEHTNLGGPWDL